jgi:MFS family permease
LVRLGGRLGALEAPAFRRVWLARTVSAVGDGVGGIAFVFGVIQISESPADLGLVLALGALARVSLLIPAGVVADRVSRSRLMVFVEVVRAACTGILATLFVAGSPRLWQIAFISFVWNGAGAFFNPASTGLVAQTVERERLVQANALLGLSRSVTAIGGPAIGGLLVATVGVGPVMFVDAASFLASALLLAGIRVTRADRVATRFLADLAEGWHEMRSRTWVWTNLITHGLANVGTATVWVLGPLVAAAELGGPDAWGFASAGLGVGAVVGGLLALRLRPRRPLVVANLALVGVAVWPLAFAPPLPLPLVIGACALAGGGLTVLNEVWVATMQRLIPDEVLARVSSYDWLVSLVVTPAAYAGVGVVADGVGRGRTLAIGAAFIAVPSVLVLLSRQVREAGAASP